MATYGRDDVAIHVDFLTNPLVVSNFVMSSNSCIYKIPTILYRENEKAYVPDAFSIGPWHFGKPNLQATQNIKLKYLHGLLHRCSSNPERQLLQLKEEVRTFEKEARECYMGSVHFSVNDFVEILVLDGCFIIELLRKDAKEVPRDPDDPIFTFSYMLQNLNHDLILLENQIPWLVLDRLFKMTMTLESKPLDQLVIEFFSNIFSSDRPPMQLLQDTNFPRHNSKHIIDLLRNSLVLSIEEHRHRLGWEPLPSATLLEKAGIKFKRVMSNSILDIKFSNGTLEVPNLLIQETTETVFRNLVSFEQCCPNCLPRVTSYVMLLGSLTNTTQDIAILSEKGIIDNWLNPEVLGKFFEKIYENTYVKDYYYAELSEQLNVYRSSRWSRWRSKLRRTYVNNTFYIYIAGIVYAGLMLALTIIGTVCSIIQAIKTK